MRGRKGLDGCSPVIVAENTGDGRYQHGLPVGAETVEEGQRVLLRRAGEGIAEEPLEELLQVGIAIGYALEEPQERRAGAARRNRSDPGHVIVELVRPAMPGL